MKTENKDLMKMARESLKGKWGLAVGTIFVYALIINILNLIPGSVLPDFLTTLFVLIISGPFALGLAIFSISISRNQNPRFNQIFKGFEHFLLTVVTQILATVFILLWTLLLIVPGIIAAISYSMTYYIIADDKTISALDAIKASKNMMRGYKWKYVCMIFRFFGWSILSILTFGIGFLWLAPYMHVTAAKFYDDIKSNNLTNSSDVVPEKPVA